MTSLAGWVDLEQAAEASGKPLGVVLGALEARGWADGMGHPTPLARRAEVARWMDTAQARGQYLWRLGDIAQALAELDPSGCAGEPEVAMVDTGQFSTLERIGQAFGRSAVATGRELKRLGWRQGNGMPSVAALTGGLALMRLTRHGRVATVWHARRVAGLLEAAGWQATGSQPSAASPKLAAG